MKTAIATLVVAMFVITEPAAAQDYRVKALPGGSDIWVWDGYESMQEGLSLINAGVHKSNPMMILNLIACRIDPGTKVIVTDMGFTSHDILVVEGSDSGCRGTIAAEELAQ